MAFTPRVREINTDTRPQDVLDCTIERITFHNEENGYSVVKVLPADVRDKNKADVIPVIGNFPIRPVEGETLRIFGRWDKHPQHGKQFRLERYETLRPATAAAIEKYLGSGMVKGIGPKAAQWMVKKFGDATLDVIENEPMKLLQIKGIGEKKIALIQKAWEEQREVRTIMLFLQGHGITPTYAVKIYRYYKERAIEQVEKNPYQLATDIWGIGFKSADKIARNLGVAYDAPQRLEAGLVYVLNQEMESGGHCFLPLRELIEEATENLYLPSGEELTDGDKAAEKAQLGQKIEPILTDLVQRGLLVAETIELMGVQETAIYTPSFHTTEKAVAERINQLIASPWRNRPKPEEIDKILQSLPGSDKLSEEQEMAVRRALSESLLVLTGGPGCGKCVVGDTLVLGTNGFTTMRSHWGDSLPDVPDGFREHEAQVVSKDGIATTSHAYCGGVRETRRVRTHLGLELEGTPNHRLWAMTETGPDWKRLDELKPGDRVAVRRGDNVWGEKSLDCEVAWTLGWCAADGSLVMPIRGGASRKIDYDEQLRQTAEMALTKWLFPLGKEIYREATHLVQPLLSWENKIVPAEILSANREAILQFLSGFFHVGGQRRSSLILRTHPKDEFFFEVVVKSGRFVQQVQLLLLNLGIVSLRRLCKTREGKIPLPIEQECYWKLTVKGEDAKRLWSVLPWRYKPNPLSNQIHLFPFNGEVAPTLSNDELWDKVESIEESEAPVYDLTVPGPHSFIANGLVNHNTFTTNFIVQALEKLGKRIQIAAPTGRAAKRAAEVSGREAKTIHRLLVFDPEKKGFKHGPSEPLELDVLVVDESSMLDLMLTHNTIRAVPDGAQIIFVGDVDQLPSVGPGNVLFDLIQSGRVPVARLTQVFRQAAASKIITNAHAINKGKLPDLLPPSAAKDGADCVFIESDETDEMLLKIKGIVAKSLPNLGFKSEEITVLSPMQRGVVGVRNLNEELQKIVNPAAPHKAEHLRAGLVLRVGDRVMQRRNNYDKNVFNGDIGYITSVDPEEQVLIVDYPEGPIEYDFAETDELGHASAITTHKSQGSEYPACVIIVSKSHYMMLQRNLVYTALTRAKKFAVIIGDKWALKRAVSSRHVQPRHTRLAQRLQNLVDGLGSSGMPGSALSLSESRELPTPPLPGRLF